MRPTDIKEFRLLVRDALVKEGFVSKRFAPKTPLAWVLPGNEILPIFFPHEIRRPWGFNLSGTIGLELLPLTAWLTERFTAEQQGAFRFSFFTYHIANDDDFRRFQVIHGEDVPVDDWVARIKDRLLELPTTVDALIKTYRRAPDHLGWVSSPMNKLAWDFLLRWYADPAADLSLPSRPF